MKKTFVPIGKKGGSDPCCDPDRVISFRGAPQYPEINNSPLLRSKITCIDRIKQKCDAARWAKIRDKSCPLDLPNIREAPDTRWIKYYNRDVRKCCGDDLSSPYYYCVARQRTALQLQENDKMREEIVRIMEKAQHPRHQAYDYNYVDCNMCRVASPTDVKDSKVYPKEASPTCSLEFVYLPSQRTMEIRKPRSGIFLNEDKISDTDIPFANYNPRILQKDLDSRRMMRYDLVQLGKKQQLYVDMNKAEKKETIDEDACCCCHLFRSPLLDQCAYDDMCQRFKPKCYEIPEDLTATFRADAVFGGCALKEDKKMTFRRFKGIACVYSAFATCFMINTRSWTTETLDEIMETGLDLYNRGISVGYKNKREDFDVIPEIIKKQTTVKTCKLYDQVPCPDNNLLKVLSTLLLKYTHLVLICEQHVMCLLIFKTCENTFCIYDPYPRNSKLCRVECGCSSLITTMTVEHIVHLIINKNPFPHVDEQYRIHSIKLVNCGLIPIPLYVGEVKKNKKYFLIVNKYYALIPGTIGIEPPKDNEDLNGSIMAAYIALVYSHIDPPNHWPRQIIDNIIKFGAKYYASHIKHHKINDMNIRDLPNVLVLGQYRALVHIRQFYISGHIGECGFFLNSSLIKSVSQCFRCFSYAILQIDHSYLAIWRDENFYYCFDPFERGPNGKAVKPTKDSNLAGCLQMHITIESFSRLLNGNSMHMKTEGTFHIHAIHIESISILCSNKYLHTADRSIVLQIYYPSVAPVVSCADLIDESKLPQAVPPECLSNLSVGQCQRANSESAVVQSLADAQARRDHAEFVRHKYSLHSLQAGEAYPEFDSSDVVHSIVNECICNIDNKIKKKQDSPMKHNMKAKKVLLKSDIGYLRDLKNRVRKGEGVPDFPTVREKATFTLEEELELPTNFRPLPDGCAIIHSHYEITSDYLRDQKVSALSALFMMVLVDKLKISTFAPATVDYIMDCASELERGYEDVRQMVTALLENPIPKIKIGSATYVTTIQKLLQGPAESLVTYLPHCFQFTNKLLILFNSFGCAVVKRYNLFYLFVGLPTDAVGFRTYKTGSPAMFRFTEVSTLAQRIHSNRINKDPLQEYIVFHTHVRNTTINEYNRFIPRTNSDEEVYYQNQVIAKMKYDQKIAEKMEILNSEIKEEKKRVCEFRKEKFCKWQPSWGAKTELNDKYIQCEKKKGTVKCDAKNACTDEFDNLSEDDKEPPPPVFKHDPNRKFEIEDPLYVVEPPRNLGYKLRDVDFLYKIQGSTAVGKRKEDKLIDDEIRACHIASSIALITLAMKPIQRWGEKDIDLVIATTKRVFEQIYDKRVMCNRIISNIEVEDHICSVNLSVYDTRYMKTADFTRVMAKLEQSRSYFLLQLRNCSFGIYVDQYYHLFDAYPTLEKFSKLYEDPQLGIPADVDENTASWVLFPTREKMIKYIDERASSEDWIYNFNLIIPSITNKKRVCGKRLLTFMLNKATEECIEEKGNLYCLEPEDMKWTDYGDLIPWSPFTKTTLDNQPRGSPQTRWNSYDIEVRDDLYSCFGTIHPLSCVFCDKSRGKQYSACCVIACCMANTFKVSEWNPNVLDTIVKNGDKYLMQSCGGITTKYYEVCLEDLNVGYLLKPLFFDIHLALVLYGILYNPINTEFNLSRGLAYFFVNHNYGVIICNRRTMAIGKADRGYFMFDCQPFGYPMFPNHEGASYVLLCRTLKRLMVCLIQTLRIEACEVEYALYHVDCKTTDADLEHEDEEDDEEDAETTSNSTSVPTKG